MTTKINLQVVEKVQIRDDGVLDLVGKPWWTIQGEGPFAGTPAVFVRLAGCVHQCSMCDTDYTSNRRMVDIRDLLVEIRSAWVNAAPKAKTPLVVITGGEPFRQNMEPLVTRLVNQGFQVQIETSGSLFQPLPYRAITIVCSPKTTTIHPNLAQHINAYKYVIEVNAVDEHDGLPTSVLGDDRRPARPIYNCVNPAQVFVQPVDSQDPVVNSANLAQACDSVLRFGYRLTLQLHKLAGLP